MIELLPEDIHIRPIGYVERWAYEENVKDRDVVSKIVIKRDLAQALDGIEDFSHLFVIFWMHKISDTQKMLVHPGEPPVGVFATRAPIRPNPIGLTLVELVKRKENALWVRGLDAYDGTPVLDIKPLSRLGTRTLDCHHRFQNSNMASKNYQIISARAFHK